jgi:hypothetical protein
VTKTGSEGLQQAADVGLGSEFLAQFPRQSDR